MSNRQITIFLAVIQVVGLIFYGVFSAVYILALPSIYILTQKPVFHSLLEVFGGLFLALMIISMLVLVYFKKKAN
jgi:hypothetical protein